MASAIASDSGLRFSFTLEDSICHLNWPLPTRDPEGPKNLPLNFLLLYQWVDLSHDPHDKIELERLAVAIRGGDPLDTGVRTPGSEELCPFRGLEPFREEDAAFYFGREERAQELEKELAGSAFTAVVSASGAGKSSLVQAGLIPRLRRRPREAWNILTMHPGNSPPQTLVRILLPIISPGLDNLTYAKETAEVTALITSERFDLRAEIQRLLSESDDPSRLLLYIDQAEELFTDCKDLDGRRHFIQTLSDLVGAHRHLRVVMTMRGDFVGQALQYPLLAKLLQGNQQLLASMTRSELRDVIVRPAQATNLEVDDELVRHILDDLRDEPGGLPLLQCYLKELWECRESDRLTSGTRPDDEVLEPSTATHRTGVLGSVNRAADRFYLSLSQEKRNRLRRVFSRLVHLDVGAQDTRKRIFIDELHEQDLAMVQQLVQEERLLVSRNEETVHGSRATLEVAHETLIRDWRRLREWIAEDREFLAFRDRLRADLNSHGSLPPPLVGLSLDKANHWLATRAIDFSVDESEYIERSRRHERNRKLRTAAAGLAVAALAGTLLWTLWTLAQAAVPATIDSARAQIQLVDECQWWRDPEGWHSRTAEILENVAVGWSNDSSVISRAPARGGGGSGLHVEVDASSLPLLGDFGQDGGHEAKE